MHRLYIVLALLVLGCGDDGSEATGGNGTLRADIIEVFPPSDTRQIVSDADVDGDRIVIVTVANIQYVYFHVSDDRGKTWATYMLDDALGTDIYWDAGGLGVHLQDGKIFFLLTREYSPRTTEWGLFEVTLVPPAATGLGATMELTEVTPSSLLHPMAFFQKRPDGHIRGMLTLGYEVPVVYELDATTGDMSADEPPCTGSACRTLIWVSGNGGDSFHGYSQSNIGVDMCRMTWHETAGTKQACVRPHNWFVPYYSHNQHVIVTEADEPYLAWSQDGEAYAIGITDAGGLTPVHPLGPGKIENFAMSRLGRPRFGGFELVYDPNPASDEGHLVRMTSHGPEQVNFRDTPCAAIGCGYTGAPNFGLSLVNYILPTGRGDYYVFYVVQSASDGTNRQALYMSPSETPTFSPIEASGPLPGPPTFTPPAGASPMTPLQEACMAAAACSPVEPDQFYLSCLRQFTVETPEHPYLAAARARLIVAAPGGCAAISQAWPTGTNTIACSAQCTKDGGTCAAGSAVCSIASPGSQCRTCSDTSTYIDCDGAEVLAVPCPSGTTCSAGVGCVLTAGCPSSDYCDGTELVSCTIATSAATSTDCVSRGGTCGASLTCESTQTGAACNSFLEKAACDGPYLTLCAVDHRVFTDCRALGHATCTVGLGGARCSD